MPFPLASNSMPLTCTRDARGSPFRARMIGGIDSGRVRAHTSCALAAATRVRKPTSGSDPFSGSQARAESSTFNACPDPGISRRLAPSAGRMGYEHHHGCTSRGSSGQRHPHERVHLIVSL
jgi:hypothetical protein